MVGHMHCVAEVTRNYPVTGALVDCPLGGTPADHSLMSGVMHSLAGTINRKAPHTQIMPCIVANQHAAV